MKKKDLKRTEKEIKFSYLKKSIKLMNYKIKKIKNTEVAADNGDIEEIKAEIVLLKQGFKKFNQNFEEINKYIERDRSYK